ncbi:hypothetical protein LRP67_11745 [Nocardioides sp. cx-169]|uniref:hypothetical protein n=1 Tax=Nocardioides sp. cx-169 TaxID=2899080 RepID=UPI001E538D5F|nr:hypothetical protein [Nocardioides sp. cx-169]MCD4534757.1 hypothetical protein [Nocardioides sp. cx-169]
MSSPTASVRSRLSSPARGLAEAAVQRARLSVVPRRRTRAPRVPFVTLVSLLLLAGVVGLLLFNTSMQQAAFTTTALEQQATTLAAREQALEMELEKLRDPQRLGERAQRAGMVQGCPPVFLDLSTGRVRGEAKPCDGARLPLEKQGPTRPDFFDPPARLAPGAGSTDGGRPVVSLGQGQNAGRDTARGNGANATTAGRTENQP